MHDSALLTRAIDTRAKAWNELNAVRNAIAKSEDGLGTAEQRAEWDRIEAVVQEATKVIEAEQRALDADRRLQAVNEDPTLNGSQVSQVPGMDTTGDEQLDAERAKAYGKAFR